MCTFIKYTWLLETLLAWFIIALSYVRFIIKSRDYNLFRTDMYHIAHFLTF